MCNGTMKMRAKGWLFTQRSGGAGRGSEMRSWLTLKQSNSFLVHLYQGGEMSSII